ncbi:MMS19 nucleotide excision repair protein homolog [Schistocerca gregaria]|uniref:MMS19 nucleotide excision repair protein homolog n=1 Tax=Schistocerca gregaria TaxID=7010 RepID=UPI00211E7B1D|nr:MMS19 nucleotide excision repair protein homolog [Schistocerca gregaria]
MRGLQLSNFLSSKVTSVMLDFLAQRLYDDATTAECLQAIWSLVANSDPDRFSELDIAKIVHQIYCSDHLSVQSLAQPVRKIIFDILALALKQCPSSVVSIGLPLLLGFIQAMDGEKDPRCLIVCYDLLVQLVLSVPHEKYAFEEDLYDITSCYFPITFTESENHPTLIKRDCLISGLRKTMISSPRLWIPFLLDKLSSVLTETKLDAVQSLLFAFSDTSVRGNAPFWPPEDVEPHLEPLLRGLLNESWNASPAVFSHILQLLTAITQFVDNATRADAHGKRSPMPAATAEHCCQLVQSACMRHILMQNQSRLFDSDDWCCVKTASDILGAAALGSSRCMRLIFKTLIPSLLSNAKTEGDPEKNALATHLLVNHVYNASLPLRHAAEHPLSDHSDSLQTLFHDLLVRPVDQDPSTSVHNRITDSIVALTLLSQTAHGSLLSQNQHKKTITAITSLLLHPPTLPSSAAFQLLLTAVKALLHISSSQLNLVLADSVQPIINTIKQATCPATLASSPHSLNYATISPFSPHQRQNHHDDQPPNPQPFFSKLIPEISFDMISILHLFCMLDDSSNYPVPPIFNTSLPHLQLKQLRLEPHTLVPVSTPQVTTFIQNQLIDILSANPSNQPLTSSILFSLAHAVQPLRSYLHLLSIFFVDPPPLHLLDTLHRLLPKLTSTTASNLSNDQLSLWIDTMYQLFIRGSIDLQTLSNPSLKNTPSLPLIKPLRDLTQPLSLMTKNAQSDAPPRLVEMPGSL